MMSQSIARYALLQCIVGDAAFARGELAFYDAHVELCAEDAEGQCTTPLQLPYDMLLHFRIVRAQQRLRITLPHVHVRAWADVNGFASQLLLPSPSRSPPSLAHDEHEHYPRNNNNNSMTAAATAAAAPAVMTTHGAHAASVLLYAQLSCADMAHFLAHTAPRVAASRRLRSVSRISLTEPLPLRHYAVDPSAAVLVHSDKDTDTVDCDDANDAQQQQHRSSASSRSRTPSMADGAKDEACVSAPPSTPPASTVSRIHTSNNNNDNDDDDKEDAAGMPARTTATSPSPAATTSDIASIVNRRPTNTTTITAMTRQQPRRRLPQCNAAAAAATSAPSVTPSVHATSSSSGGDEHDDDTDSEAARTETLSTRLATLAHEAAATTRTGAAADDDMSPMPLLPRRAQQHKQQQQLRTTTSLLRDSAQQTREEPRSPLPSTPSRPPAAATTTTADAQEHNNNNNNADKNKQHDVNDADSDDYLAAVMPLNAAVCAHVAGTMSSGGNENNKTTTSAPVTVTNAQLTSLLDGVLPRTRGGRRRRTTAAPTTTTGKTAPTTTTTRRNNNDSGSSSIMARRTTATRRTRNNTQQRSSQRQSAARKRTRSASVAAAMTTTMTCVTDAHALGMTEQQQLSSSLPQQQQQVQPPQQRFPLLLLDPDSIDAPHTHTRDVHDEVCTAATTADDTAVTAVAAEPRQADMRAAAAARDELHKIDMTASQLRTTRVRRVLHQLRVLVHGSAIVRGAAAELHTQLTELLSDGKHADELGVNSLAFSPHTPHVLCSGGCDDTVALWDTRMHTMTTTTTTSDGVGSAAASAVPQTLSCVMRLCQHRAPVNHVLFAPHNDVMLLSASDDATVACWDVRRPDTVVERISGFGDGVNKMLLVPVAAAQQQQQHDREHLHSNSSNYVAASAASSHGVLLVSACDDGLVYVHALGSSNNNNNSGAGYSSNSSGSALVDRFWASTSTVNDVLLLPDSDIVVTASEDGALRSWRLLCDPTATTDARLVVSLDAFDSAVNHVVLAPALYSTLLASNNTGDEDEHDENNAAAAAAAGAGGVYNDDAAAVHHAGAAATTAMMATTGVYNARGGGGIDDVDDDDSYDGNNDHANTTSTRPPQRLSPSSPHTRWLLAASAECVFGVDVDTRSGRYGCGARRFLGHRDYVRGIEFTPRHPNTLLSVSDDGTLIEWQLRSGEALRQVALHDGCVMASTVSYDGAVLATGSHLGEVRLWRLPLQTECMGASA